MSCNKPVAVFELVGIKSKTGKKVLVHERPKGGEFVELLRACGGCFGCRQARRDSLRIRLYHETQMSSEAFAITLTYAPEFLPYGYCLEKSHVQKFVRSLRKRVPERLRYFFVGEYGTDERPHYHGIVWGHCFPDRVPTVGRKGFQYFESPLLSEAWGKGFADLTSVSLQNCGYFAKYHVDKRTGPAAADRYVWLVEDTNEVIQRPSEFALMSLRPGIGASWFDKFALSDIYDADDCVIVEGGRYRPPVYYDVLLERKYPDLYEAIKAKRAEVRDLYGSLDSRRDTKEECRRIRFERFLERSLA